MSIIDVTKPYTEHLLYIILWLSRPCRRRSTTRSSGSSSPPSPPSGRASGPCPRRRRPRPPPSRPTSCAFAHFWGSEERERVHCVLCVFARFVQVERRVRIGGARRSGRRAPRATRAPLPAAGAGEIRARRRLPLLSGARAAAHSGPAAAHSECAPVHTYFTLVEVMFSLSLWTTFYSTRTYSFVSFVYQVASRKAFATSPSRSRAG